MKQQILAAGQGKDYDWAKDHVYVKTTVELTGGRVTVVEDALKAGFHLARHHHRSMVEIFYILEGSIRFAFDDEVVLATPGMTLNIPPNVWHDVSSEGGGKLLTVFTPGGFDSYLSEIAAMAKDQLDDAALMTRLAERYDIWMRDGASATAG
jgi:quercetin dioxygenase-like cupin family protein